MAAYSYKVKGLVNAPAQQVGELLEDLQNSPNGLTPAAVVNASREEGTLLHDEFEWDDAIAGEKYRLQQASNIIRNVVVIRESTDQEEREQNRDRAFVVTPGGKSAYVTLSAALSNDVWHEHLLKDAHRDMESFIAKYRRLEELSDIVQTMSERIKTI